MITSVTRTTVNNRHNDRLSYSGTIATARTIRSRDEAGAVLVLAIVFLVVVGMIVGALAAWTANDLNNTATFTSARSLQYAIGGATNVAIQSIRYTPLLGSTLNASPPSYCWGSGANGDSQLAGLDQQNANLAVAVWCSTAWNPDSTATRVVTFSACPVPSGVQITSSTAAQYATSCAARPNLQAVVAFDDYTPGTSAFPPTPLQCFRDCGTVMTQRSWVWSPKVPTVSGVSSTSTLSSGDNADGSQATVTITGTGFTANATVTFISQTGGTSVSGYLVPASASGVVVSPPTSITANLPWVATGNSSYSVTVTTPGGGTSAYTATSPVFTYTAAVPTVTSVGPILKAPNPLTAGGSTAGATPMTITGTGFSSNDVVNLIPVAGGTTVQATGVTVSPSGTISAYSPTVTTGTSTYYVSVSTPGVGSSTYSSTSGPFFNYFVSAPTVSGLTASAGSHSGGTGITITGNGFVTGDVVNFALVSNPLGTIVQVPIANVSVQGPTTIGISSPAVTILGGYYVTVTTPGCSGNVAACTSGGGTTGPIFTYTS